MEPIQWSRWMSVGIDELDEDHRHLVAIANRLAEEETRGRPEAVAAVLDDLIAYARKHFAAEEAHMERAGYPTFAAHKALHDALTEQVEAYRRGFHAAGGIPGDEVHAFTMDWLAKHILKEDVRFGEFAVKGG